jgi:23S rRNA (uracil1939-C5)-methyltransferase
MGDQILQLVREYVRDSNVPVYGLKSHEGFWRFLTLRYSAAFNEWMVNLVTSEERSALTGPLSELLCRRFENIRTVVNNINSSKAAIAFGEKEVVLAGDGYIQDRIGKFCFQISANSFFQTNTSGALRLYDKVVEYAGLKGSETVLDLYCGTGTIPIFLSEKAKEVMGMEIVESAVLDAKKNCRENKINNCRFLLGDIRNNLSGLQLRPDVLVVDPPRAGMHKDVLSSVLELAADRIVYVSCNPATMARDMKELIKQYDIIDIQPVDMFPHTFHIEAVARLVRRTNG